MNGNWHDYSDLYDYPHSLRHPDGHDHDDVRNDDDDDVMTRRVFYYLISWIDVNDGTCQIDDSCQIDHPMIQDQRLQNVDLMCPQPHRITNHPSSFHDHIFLGLD